MVYFYLIKNSENENYTSVNHQYRINIIPCNYCEFEFEYTIVDKTNIRLSKKITGVKPLKFEFYDLKELDCKLKSIDNFGFIKIELLEDYKTIVKDSISEKQDFKIQKKF